MSTVLQKSYLGSHFLRINQTFATNCTYSNIAVSGRLGPVYITTVRCLCVCQDSVSAGAGPDPGEDIQDALQR